MRPATGNKEAKVSQPDARILPGVALMIVFCVTAPMIDVFAKLATAELSVGQVTLARFSVQASLMLPVLILLGLNWRVSPQQFGWLCLRAAVALIFTATFVAAVSVMPIADALAILFVSPFILMLLGRYWFQEEVGTARVVLSLIGFGGALLVIQPSLIRLGWVALLPLATALFFAIYLLLTRRLSGQIHPVTLQAHTAIVAVLLLAPWVFLSQDWVISWVEPPTVKYWAFLLGVGVAASVSHLAMTYALKFAPSATLAPLQYLEIPAAVIAGYWIFGDFPAPMTWLGIAIIIGSGLGVIYREHRQWRRRA
jgi:drug/metabolite transporter (DMT)-like permease